jgi:L,D-transpeptidase catalytic domain
VRRRLPALAGCAAALTHAVAVAASAHAEEAPAGRQPTQPAIAAPAPAPDVRLSNERTLTTWAHPVAAWPIYSSADKGSRRVGRVRLETEDGFPETYLLLLSHTDPQGRAWVLMRIPGRPNGQVGWVLRRALGGLHQTRWLLEINLRERRLTAYLDGRRHFTAPVGVGKPSTPTPAGLFWIRERFQLQSRTSPYWPYALGTSAYSTLTDWPGGGVVGIHGDFGEPWAIPGDPSHGCVRMRDADLAWLAPRLTLGTPVDIF